MDVPAIVTLAEWIPEAAPEPAADEAPVAEEDMPDEEEEVASEDDVSMPATDLDEEEEEEEEEAEEPREAAPGDSVPGPAPDDSVPGPAAPGDSGPGPPGSDEPYHRMLRTAWAMAQGMGDAPRRQCRTALQRSVSKVTEEAPPGHGVSFVTTCFRRRWQLQQVLLFNIVAAWPWRSCVRFFAVIFDEPDEAAETVRWIMHYAKAAVDLGMLTVCLAKGMPFWHACIAKNTSHRAAIELRDDIPLEQHFVVNVDGDNAFSDTFVPSVMREVAKGYQASRNHICCWHGQDAGCTGRQGYWADLFKRLHGFDESLLPSGYQEVDLCDRAKLLEGGRANVRRFAASAGFSVLNDPAATKRKSATKIMHVDPSLGLTWGKMNERNVTAARAKTARGEYLRNTGIPFSGLGVKYKVVRGTEPDIVEVGDSVPPPPPAEEVGDSVPPPPPPPPPPAASWGEPGPPAEPRAQRASLRAPGLRLRFFTTGVHIIGGLLPHRRLPAAQRLEQRSRQRLPVEEGLIVDCLREGRLVDATDVSITIDCRMLLDPNRDYKLHFHHGMHPQIVQSFVEANEALFRNWLQNAVKALESAVRRATREGRSVVNAIFSATKAGTAALPAR